MNIVNNQFLKSNFPPIKYAFISNYIVRTSLIRKLKEVEKPIVDTIIVCENIDQWHKENFKMNKKHYPLISKIFTYRIVNYFQKKGAKIHFNYFNSPDGKLLRYGVVAWDDFIKDLEFWKTLTVSSYMHKPYEVIIENEEVSSSQKKNLMSAICVAALFNLGDGENFYEISEEKFFDTIIKLPFIQGSFFKIFDDKVINFDITELIDEFRSIYLPILEEIKKKPEWNDYIVYNYEKSSFTIKNDFNARKFFLDNVNSQIFNEISLISHGKNILSS